MRQTDRFIGAWELVPELSLYETGTPPASGHYTITETAPGVLAIHMRWQAVRDGPFQETGFSSSADGTPQPLLNAQGAPGLPDTFTLTRVDAQTLDSSAVAQGREVAFARRVASNDGNLLAVVQEQVNPEGRRTRHFQVYRRLDGPRPLSPGTSPLGFTFTGDVRKILSRSREEAGLLGNEYVGPEHMLLGLIHVNAGNGARVLERLHVEIGTLRTRILAIVKHGAGATGPDLPYTSRAKRVLEMAMTAARDLKHDYVGTEHLLLGLAQDKGPVRQLLTDAGADEQAVRRETLALFSA